VLLQCRLLVLPLPGQACTCLWGDAQLTPLFRSNSAGTYADKPRTGSCKPCPAGAYCPNEGTASPTLCPPGTYGPRANGSNQRLSCLPCNAATNPGTTTC
jgi:hypothetical protein